MKNILRLGKVYKLYTLVPIKCHWDKLLLIYMFSATAFSHRGRTEVLRQTVGPAKPKIFTPRPFAGQVC